MMLLRIAGLGFRFVSSCEMTNCELLSSEINLNKKPASFHSQVFLTIALWLMPNYLISSKLLFTKAVNSSPFNNP